MKKNHITCSDCNTGFCRIELASRRGTRGEFRCPICDEVVEVFDGSREVAYRLTVANLHRDGSRHKT